MGFLLSRAMIDRMALFRGLIVVAPDGFVDDPRGLLEGRLAGIVLGLGGSVLDSLGRSAAHASQQRKFAGFERVQIGHDQLSGEKLSSVVKSTGEVSGNFSSDGGFEAGLELSGIGGGEPDDRGPAGFSWLGGIYELPYASFSSC